MVDAVAAIEVAAQDAVAPVPKAVVAADARGLVAVSGVQLLTAANREPIVPKALVANRLRAVMQCGSCCLPAVAGLVR